jgi:hypothetical protein
MFFVRALFRAERRSFSFSTLVAAAPAYLLIRSMPAMASF